VCILIIGAFYTAGLKIILKQPVDSIFILINKLQKALYFMMVP